MGDKYLWYSDTHLNSTFPWSKYVMYHAIEKERPKGLFLTGDISNGVLLKHDLSQLAQNINCPIYFVLGNHDYFWSGIDKTHKRVRNLCKTYNNLFWLTESPIIELDEDIGLIGTEGWYDLSLGDSKYIKYTFDWFCIPDFRKMSSMDERFNAFKQMATVSSDFIEKQLISAFDKGYKTIYLLTHFPIFAEATFDLDSFFGKWWLSYNINYRLGETVKKIMDKNKKKNLIVLSGHVHERQFAQVSRNIISFTSAASYWNTPKNENRLFI
jgi:predicted phosphohydrolase